MTKLTQLNIWGGRLDNPLKAYFSAEPPDILCLQEAISFNGNDAGFFLTIEEIQELCDLPYASFAPTLSFQFMNGTAGYGNCILSKHPITKTETVFTHLEHQSDFDTAQHTYNIRNFVHAVITTNDKPLNVITHHGYHIREHKNGNDETQRQMHLLADYITQLDGPTILCGDFNLAPDSTSIQILNKLLENQSVTHKLTTTRTALTHKTEVCDYIFTNKDVKVADFEASDALISDHQALTLNFTL